MNASPDAIVRPADRPAPAPGLRLRPVSPPFIDVLHLFVLSAFAIAQPVYDRLGDRAAFIADMRIGFPALCAVVVLLSLVLPLTLAGVVEGIGRLIRGRGALLSIVVYALLAAFLLPVVKRWTALPVWSMIALALAGAGVSTWAYFAYAKIRSVVTVAAPSVLVFPVLFLFYSPAGASFFTHYQVKTTRWQPVPVVMLVLDELRGTMLVNDANEIDAERFPHFAELAGESTWFRNASTVYPDTWQALPSILSGRYPTTKWVPQAADLPQNLFSVLDSTGEYDLVVFEPVSRVAPRRLEIEAPSVRSVWSQLVSLAPALSSVYLAHLAPVDLQSSLPQIPRLWFGMHENPKIDRSARHGIFRYSWGLDRRIQFEHFMDCLDNPEQPTLYFMHVLLPHIPWCYLPSGRKYLPESNQWELMDFDTHSEFLDYWGTDELYVLQSHQRHLLQLIYTDRLLGQMLERLRETGLFDRCLLVVTADHGLCLRTSEARRNLTATNLADIMSVPLFIKKPGQHTAEVSDRNVESVDILPTIADLLGIELKLPVDGRSVFDTAPERTEKTIYRPADQQTVPASIIRDSWRPGELTERFGAADDPAAIYRMGPNPELLGRRVDETSQASGQSPEVKLIRSGNIYDPDDEAIVPCLVEGRIVSPGTSGGPLRLVVAVNGVIQATTRTYLLDGVRDRFSALIPESAFRVGPNDIEYYLVSDEGAETRLTRCNAVPARR